MTQALTPPSPAAPGGAPRLDIVIFGLSITRVDLRFVVAGPQYRIRWPAAATVVQSTI